MTELISSSKLKNVILKRRNTLTELIGKFNLEIDCERLNELEIIHNLIKKEMLEI